LLSLLQRYQSSVHIQVTFWNFFYVIRFYECTARTKFFFRVSAVDNFDLPLMAFGGKLGRPRKMVDIFNPYLYNLDNLSCKTVGTYFGNTSQNILAQNLSFSLNPHFRLSKKCLTRFNIPKMLTLHRRKMCFYLSFLKLTSTLSPFSRYGEKYED